MIHCDNQSCVQMLVNPVFHDKSKHTEIQYHFIHDMVQKVAVELQYILTDDCDLRLKGFIDLDWSECTTDRKTFQDVSV